MAKSVIVVKKPGEIVTAAYVARLVKEFPNFMGTALTHEGELVVDHKKGKLTVEAVMEVQEAFKDKQIVFFFSDAKDMLDEDQQPFEIEVDKASGTKIAVAMEGNFEGYTVPKSTHTNEWHCKEDFISKKLQKIYRVANSGLPGLLTELDDDLTKQEISNSWTSRGFITFLTTAAPAVSVVNRGHVFRSDYNWGTTSNSLNYVEQTVAKEVKEAAEKPADKPLSKLEQLRAKLSGKAPVASAAAVPPVEEKKTDTAVVNVAAALSDDNFEYISLPPEAHQSKENWTNKQKVQWWVTEVGYKPDGFKDMKTKVKRTKGTKIGVLAPLAATNTVEEPKVEPVKEAPVDPRTLPDKKPAEEHVKDVSPRHVSMDNMPILSPKQKLLLKKDWMADAEVIKTLGDDFKAMAFDPKRLKELEDTYATFYDGMGLDNSLWLSFEALIKLGEKDLKALAVYAFNRQNDNASANIKLKSVMTDPGKRIAQAM